MTTATRPLTIEITGDGRLVSNVGSHGADPKNFVIFKDLYVDAAHRIRKRPGIGAAQGASLAAAVTAMHEFLYVSGLTETRWLFRASETTIQYWTGAAWSTMTLPYSPTAGGLWVFENAANRCFAVNGKDAEIVFDGTSWKIAGGDGPASPMGYVLSGTFDATTGGAHTITATKGSPTVTKSGGAAWDGIGPTYYMNGDPIEINGNRYTISTVDAASTLTLTEGFKEENFTGSSYKIFYGVGSWDLPPRYAYAYENPTTGHTTNIRAAALTNDNITEIVEQNKTNQTITLNNIVYDPTLYAQGFTKIRIYRTAKNANILQALDTTINNSSGSGTTTFTETATTFVDTFLTKFPAQRTKLGKPPSGLIAIRYHQGRMFGITKNRLYYSLHEADVVGELGVSQEAWPPQQYITVNGARGLVVIGADGGDQTLVVQTFDGDFAVIGYDQRTIAIVRLPSESGGSYQYGALGLLGNLIALYAQKRVIDSGGTDYGDDIQDKFDAVKDSIVSGARIHRFKWQSWNLLLVSVPKSTASTTNDVTYVFDFREGRWYEWSKGFTSFATSHGASGLELWGSDSTGNSFLLLQPNTWQDAGSNFQPTFTTSMLWPTGELEECDLKVLQAYVSDSAQTWTGELLINEQAAGAGQAFTLTQSRHFEQSAQGKQMDWTPPLTIRTLSSPFQISLTFPAVNSDLFIEKGILFFGADVEPRA